MKNLLLLGAHSLPETEVSEAGTLCLVQTFTVWHSCNRKKPLLTDLLG